MNRKQLSKSLLLILLLLYWAVSLRHLTVIPPVYEDEPWQASTGWKLATEGVFGSNLFAGFYGMEDHYYGYMPVHPFLLAAVFKLAGLGLFQARFEPVVMGLFILALTYALGRRLFRPSVALLAVFLLLFTRTTGLTPSQYSGILIIDIARIARYDMVVPVFALAALLLYTAHLPNYQLRTNLYVLRFTHYALIGLLTALAALSHLYGLFWFVALLLLMVWQRLSRRQLLAFLVGFFVLWIVYLLYVAGGWSDWVGQTQDYAPRFELSNLSWYLGNLVKEIRRYGPGLGEVTWFRPGFWMAVLIVPLSTIGLGRLAFRGNKKAQTLFIPVVILPILFGLLIYLKLSNYLITLAPLFALVMAWGIMTANDYLARSSTHLNLELKKIVRLTLIILVAAIALEGFLRFISLEKAAGTTTPYPDYAAEIKNQLPSDGRILALHNYWFGFESWDYRSWFVPLLQNNPDYWQPPVSIETALESVDPTIILIDQRMRDLFAADPETAEAIFEWISFSGFIQTAIVEDGTYGRMDIYSKAETDE